MKLKYQYAIQPIADSFMAMAITEEQKAQNTLLRVNQTGKDMLEMLQQDTTEEELVKKLMEQYEAAEPVIRESVQKFITELNAKGLLD
ncbi:MAG: PqqD family protein [Bacteroidaceae bacterium]|nr:PqqD family protein [Bacteroidaceae bacterium]